MTVNGLFTNFLAANPHLSQFAYCAGPYGNAQGIGVALGTAHMCTADALVVPHKAGETSIETNPQMLYLAKAGADGSMQEYCDYVAGLKGTQQISDVLRTKGNGFNFSCFVHAVVESRDYTAKSEVRGINEAMSRALLSAGDAGAITCIIPEAPGGFFVGVKKDMFIKTAIDSAMVYLGSKPERPPYELVFVVRDAALFGSIRECLNEIKSSNGSFWKLLSEFEPRRYLGMCMRKVFTPNGRKIDPLMIGARMRGVCITHTDLVTIKGVCDEDPKAFSLSDVLFLSKLAEALPDSNADKLNAILSVLQKVSDEGSLTTVKRVATGCVAKLCRRMTEKGIVMKPV